MVRDIWRLGSLLNAIDCEGFRNASSSSLSGRWLWISPRARKLCMARRVSLSPSSRRPFLLDFRSAPRSIVLVACYGIFTVSGNDANYDFEGTQLIETMVQHLFFYGMVSSLDPTFLIFQSTLTVSACPSHTNRLNTESWGGPERLYVVL